MNKREKGCWGEDLALAFLKGKGYTIIDRNFRTRYGEIDIIALDEERIVFVEVKVVGAYTKGELGRIVGPVKRRRIRTAGRMFLRDNPHWEKAGVRCDVIMVIPGEDHILHLENAF